jgi:hypothetical protein
LPNSSPIAVLLSPNSSEAHHRAHEVVGHRVLQLLDAVAHRLEAVATFLGRVHDRHQHAAQSGDRLGCVESCQRQAGECCADLVEFHAHRLGGCDHATDGAGECFGLGLTFSDGGEQDVGRALGLERLLAVGVDRARDRVGDRHRLAQAGGGGAARCLEHVHRCGSLEAGRGDEVERLGQLLWSGRSLARQRQCL